MSHIYEGMNSEPTSHRVQKGKLNEAAIAACLNKYHGFELKASSMHDDTQKKRDFYEEKGGTIAHHQIKSRASGVDILYDRFEPYYGVDNPQTKDGRDQVGQFDFFDCLTKDGKTIRSIKAARMREIIADLDKEFKAAGCPFVFSSKKYPGAQYRKHIDQSSGRPKLLCFLPSKLFDESKGEIKYYKMDLSIHDSIL